MLSSTPSTITGLIESNRTLKNLPLFSKSLESLVCLCLTLLMSCSGEKSQEQLQKTQQLLDFNDTNGFCWGTPTQNGENVCAQQFNENDCTTAGPLDENNQPLFSEPICEWVDSTCRIKSEVCRNQTTYGSCTLASQTGQNLGNCSWFEDAPPCTGSIASTCATRGLTAESCNALPIACVWDDYAAMCIPEVDCTGIVKRDECTAMQNATLPDSSFCTWDAQQLPSCIGSISIACLTHGKSEVECNALSPFDCQWVNDECVPETDCNQLDETACPLMSSTSLPPTATCSWRLNTPGTCTGVGYFGGEGQCIQINNEESCNSFVADRFHTSLCIWSESSCHVKSTACTDQSDDEYLCFNVSPHSYAFGECAWQPE